MRTPRYLAAIGAVAMIATACSGGGGGGDGEVIDLSAEPDTSVEGEVSILHAFTGEEDVGGLNAIIDAFNEQYPNITVEEQGDNNFESLARTRVGSGQAPDIILHPQPGLLNDFYNDGATRILTPADNLESDLVGGLFELGTINGDFSAVPMRLSLKSLVWYNVPAWEAGGYEIPETWAELQALTEEIAANGDVEAPWCIGMESGDATGWVATDWVEDILLRDIGPEAYDEWVAGDLDFASDEVKSAIEDYMVPIWTNDDYVFGGRENIAREPFGTSINGILTGEGGDCMLHRQATFIEGFIKEANPDATFGEDYDFFFLPGIEDGAGGTPALGAGDYAALYSDNEAAVEFMKFLTTPEAGEGWAARGGFLSPFTTFDAEVYPTESSKRAGELLADATSFRFDGSDLMPADVGASSGDGAFWNEMTAWITGQAELEEALASIDEKYDEVG